ncbi:MAG: prepilin-type N-terminal cleavage/methylation domain-containing protein [Planctomycetota bacterium]|jgi:prepilin-type N-terminal cleavage/methylation domain-containing protein
MRDNKGFTLVEIMVSLVVLLVVFLGMMQTVLVGIDSNMVNLLRAEAVTIAEQQMNQARDTGFPLLATTPASIVARDFRRIPGFQYTTTQTVTILDGNNKQVTILVTWPWKTQVYNHTIQTIVRNPNA